MSTALCPSSDTEPRRATDLSVMSVRLRSFTWKVTSTSVPLRVTAVTDPTSTPAMRTGEPEASPATLVNVVFSE